MRRRPLFWKVYPYYVLVIFIAMVLAAIYGASEMKALYISKVTSSLEEHARVTIRVVKPLLSSNEIDLLDRECKELAKISGTRITVVDAQGKVLGDSHEAPLSMENHGSRPEIVIAYSGAVGIKTRYSNTLQANLMYAAIPIMEGKEVTAVVRTAVPVSEVETSLASFGRNIAIGGAIIVLLAALVSILVLRRLTVPLRELRNGAGRFAAGELDSRLAVPSTVEIADLAESMNEMAKQLDLRMKTIEQQRNEREAILSSMSDGILALDSEEKIVLLNRVAADFLDLDIERAQGKTFYEMIRIPSILELVDSALQSPDITETEITLPRAPEQYLQARAASLTDIAGNRIGVVIVFNDITRLKRLETMRRDFVANVSHELKTPITAIVGSIETLREGAAADPEDRQRFLEMIARHSDRLIDMVEDLLSLAQIESEGEGRGVPLTRGLLIDVIESSLLACQESGRQHEVDVSISCDPNLEISMNRGQLEQAITNLIENAIKYSERGKSVSVEVAATATEIVITVRDSGIGIAAEHLPRLFERFYRVDRSRSRGAGGTGLGLAIVKHVAAAHKGRVSVDSSLANGSAFRIHLPQTQ